MGRTPAIVVLLAGLAGAAPATASMRPDDPVVLPGAKLGRLAGAQPGSVVGFSYRDGRWRQVPVQVDERASVDFGSIYNGRMPGLSSQRIVAYTTADPDTTLDADDELVFMAADAGARPPRSAGSPPGITRGLPAVEVRVRDPLDGAKGSVYLFARAKGLDPGAGRRAVTYRFSVNAGTYPGAYNFPRGPNPETSVVKTKAYEVRFGDRWQMDALRIRANGATGVDILDRARAQFRPGDCVRTEDTFDAGEGAFVINKSGPVRAIRSYVGANSGPLTQREHVYYAVRQDITTFLRVHAIGAVMEVFDYASEAIGMTYRNDLATAGVRIDGVRDTLPTGRLRWEQVTGRQGTLTLVHRLDTDIPSLAISSYYADTTTPGPNERPCTGDSQLLGVSGPRVTSPIPNTDPRTPGAARLTTTRTLYAEAPGGDAALAQRRARQATTPLVAKVAPFSPSSRLARPRAHRG